ncbi:hypothetical protein J4E93_004089 [Alternaria ventricosa]|uniref:uncharacterized protein n=1 Tax=Alternaria ventricosa TaxID=1187951 RepID=UPI0020C29F40|nr:uncharacterized protein J4E93_004089 [Alternaria ventricosa]KAI4647679.1 hypothetical protein J4E93_004089 [Alternaria ventricosa]
MDLPNTKHKLSMSLPEEQQEDTSSSMNSAEAQAEKLETEVELEFEEDHNTEGEPNSEEVLSIEEKSAIEEELRIKAAEQEQRLNEITYLNATTSPLLLLPAEIRNIIFALALDHQDIIIVRGRMYNKVRSPVNLLRVCRQIHAETALLPYELNFFAVSNWGELLLPFLQRRTQDQLGVMIDMEVLRTTDLVEFVLCGLEWWQYEEKYRLAAARIFKSMNSKLLAQNEE